NTFGYRPDEANDSPDAALDLTAVDGVYTASGVIAPLDDADYFRFSARGATTITVGVDPYDGNLDAAFDLFDADGNFVDSIDPGDTFDATGSWTLGEGNYVVAVHGSGAPGAVGRYSLNIAVDFAPTASI